MATAWEVGFPSCGLVTSRHSALPQTPWKARECSLTVGLTATVTATRTEIRVQFGTRWTSPLS
jgi:hypothetical protein